MADHLELLKSQTTTMGGGFKSNSDIQQGETIQALANLVTATSNDRNTNVYPNRN